MLTVGSIIFVIGVNGIAIHHRFITGGMYGACLFLYYKTHWLSPGYLYLLVNIPLCIFAWKFVGRKFVLYSLYAVLVITQASQLIRIDFGIKQQIYAAIARKLKLGATFIKGKGVNSKKDKDILLTITNTIQLKKLEETVFLIDKQALFIVENSYDVIGSSFSKRKIY